MKTLDEVITGMTELILSGKTADVKSTVREALRYLKEYSSKQDTIAEQLAELEQKNDNVCELAKTVCEEYDRLCNRLAEEYRNDPLTWNELKAMEGKPVWVEQCNGDTKGWLLILRTNYDVINCTTKHGNSFYLYKSSYGEKWQAYRKERG